MTRAGLGMVLVLLVAPQARGQMDDVPASALASERRALTATERKIDSRLRPLHGARRTRSPLVPLAPGEDVRLYVRLGATAEPDLALLRAHGLAIEIVDAGGGRVQGVVAPGRIAELAALSSVIALRPVERGRLRTGAVTSEGDAASHADVARSFGYDGTGTMVGVISDGIDSAAAAVSSGDLGPVTVPAGAGCAAGSGDEGTALLEIVHDLAPGATLAFSGGLTSSLAFVGAIHCLVAAGAQVIADDLAFFDEPFFADGPVAAAVRAAVQAGVSFHSAAGNDNGMFVEQPYRASPSSTFHDFLGGPVDNGDDVEIPPGGTLVCVLQWNDPFGASANDYDLAVFDASLNLVAASTNPQTGTQDPLEAVGVVNPSGSPVTAKVAIDRASGAARTLRMFCLGGLNQQYVTPSGSIFGHAAVPEAVTVAAIDVADAGQDDVEAFSSRGPARILLPAPVTRAKPDLAGFDGVSITNAGGFPGCPPSCLFFGTSAAVPHSAALAALLRSKNPFLSPAAIAGALRAGAVDVGPAGFDDAAGAGRIDAVAALSAVAVPECLTSAACDDGDPCTADACSAGICQHPPVDCDDGDRCNGAERCDVTAGCVAGTPLSCADADPCTVDGCDPAAGCTNVDLPGLDWVSCALDLRLRPLLPDPRSVASRRAIGTARGLLAELRTAERRVASAARAGGARARRRLARARRTVLAMRRTARRRGADLASTAVQAIVLETGAIAGRIRTVRGTL